MSNEEQLRAVAEALRHTSSLNTGTPTRTVRLTTLEQEQNQSSRDATPSAIAERIILRSSSSRPSSRQQRRFESPLENEPIRGEHHVNRISIRPLAGNDVGGVLARNRMGAQPHGVHEVVNESDSKGIKLKHSHRKIRRWNNDRMVDLDISSAKVRQIFADAKAEAHHHKEIVDPLAEKGKQTYKRFMTDDGLKDKREAFFQGIGPSLSSCKPKTSSQVVAKPSLSRLDPRLRRLVERAHRNSCAATKVLKTLETYVTSKYYSNATDTHLESVWYEGLLLGAPQVDVQHYESLRVEFKFDASSQSSGFHRLLLSAIGEFHSIKVHAKNRPGVRALILVGKPKPSDALIVRLSEVLEEKEGGDQLEVPCTMDPRSDFVDDFSIVESVSTYVVVSDEECL